MTKIPVYFMPGLAASISIFEGINLPKDQFDCHFIEWKIPLPNESLNEYAKRIATEIKHENIILIGVSFGGVLVQEMAKYLSIQKLIIISSVKSKHELPIHMKLAKKTKAYKLIPTSLLEDVDKLVKYAFGETLKRKLDLYEKFLHMRNKTYLNWAIEQMVCWSRSKPDANVIHIQGDKDEVFPIKNIQNYISVPGGTHAMILTKCKWLSENLPKIILDK